MTRSSPWRRSQILSSPDRQYLSDFLGDNRNNETSHRDALAAAQAEHDRVREAAVRVFELHEMQEEHKRILEAEKREQERLRTEAQIAAEEKRLQELRATTIPKPTPPAPPKASLQAEPPQPHLAAGETHQTTQNSMSNPQLAYNAGPSGISASPGNAAQPISKTTPPPAPSNGATRSPQIANAASKLASSTGHAVAPAAQANGFASPLGAGFPSQPSSQVPSRPADDRYMQIHKALKKLRIELQSQARTPGSPMKAQLGQLRRDIRVSIGQLTGGQKGVNSTPTNKIMSALRQGLDGTIQSPPIDVSIFVTKQRKAVEGALHNESTLPALFIYLMNICAKGIINQYISECGANPKAADPIGVVAALIFSDKEFFWRGETLIDILIAKFRVVCPALFGCRGKDTTERGRQVLGWKRDGASWIPEQTHRDRMAGLGAGFASLSLRDFSRVNKTNPYPPTNYWKALAFIVNTPQNETSDTQYVVLRAMIEGHERRFLQFYGNAGLAALRAALIDFPTKAPAKSTAAGSLQALAELLQAEEGLVLS